MSTMKELSMMWDEAKPEERSTPDGQALPEVAELEDGEYLVRVVFFNYWEKKGVLWYKWGLRVTEGVCKGSYIEKFTKVNEISMGILAGDVVLLTGEKPSFAAIFDKKNNRAGSIQGELKGKTIKMRQKTNKNGYPVFYFNECVDDTREPEDTNTEPDFNDDEEIPF